MLFLNIRGYSHGILILGFTHIPFRRAKGPRVELEYEEELDARQGGVTLCVCQVVMCYASAARSVVLSVTHRGVPAEHEAHFWGGAR